VGSGRLSDAWQQVSENPNVPGDYNNNIDYTSQFVFNTYVDSYGVYISSFDTQKNHDTLKLPYETALLSGRMPDGDVAHGWHDVMLGSGARNDPFFRFRSDAYDTARGFELTSARVCTTDTRTTAKNPSPHPTIPAMRNTGVLLGSGDTVYFEIPVGPTKYDTFCAESDQVHDTFALWGEPSASTDFDLYARCGALPTESQYDGDRGFSNTNQEFIHAPVGTCPCGSHWYVAVHSYQGAGMFSFVAHKHYAGEHRGTSSWAAWWDTEHYPGAVPPVPLSNAEICKYHKQIAMGYKHFFGANEGARYWDHIEFWPGYRQAPADLDGVIKQQYDGRPGSCICGHGWDTELCTFSNGGRIKLYRGWSGTGSPDAYDGRALSHEMGHFLNCLEDEYHDGSPTRLECGHSIMSSEWGHQNNYCYCNDDSIGGHECSQGNGDHGWDTTPVDNSTIQTEAVWTRIRKRAPFAITSTPDNYDYRDFSFGDRYAQVTVRPAALGVVCP
jgi:hypothetical protein